MPKDLCASALGTGGRILDRVTLNNAKRSLLSPQKQLNKGGRGCPKPEMYYNGEAQASPNLDVLAERRKELYLAKLR